MADTNHALAWIESELVNLRAAGLLTTIRTIDSPMDAWVTIEGRRCPQFLCQQLFGVGESPTPAAGRAEGRRSIWGRARSRAAHCRHHVTARRIGRGIGTI